MEGNGNKFPAWVLVFVLFCSFVSQALSSQHGTKVKGLVRNKRQICVDGAYDLNGKNCCRCGVGQKLVKPCDSQPDDRTCAPCERNTYNSEPNFDVSCKPCISCAHPSSNLEVDEPCTPGRNTKCRCKKDHYCTTRSLHENCVSCSPCEVCGPEGTKIACTATNNTVCNEKKTGIQTGTVVAVVVGLLAALAVIGVVIFFMKKRTQQQAPPPVEHNDEGLPLLDLQPHLYDIAEVLGWKDMKKLALRSGITRVGIDSCKLDNPGDSQGQTLQLLEKWVEKEGREASRSLIKQLKAMDKKRKAEELKDNLAEWKIDSAAGSNVPV